MLLWKRRVQQPRAGPHSQACEVGLVQAVTPAPSPPRTAVEAYVVGSQGLEPPNFPRGDHLSQEHFLLPHGGWLGAPEAVFAALLREQVSRC